MKNPSVALDVETTGLDETKAELLSLSFVLETPDSFRNSIETKNLPYLSLVFVKPTPLNYLEEGAGAMNANLLKFISEYRHKKKDQVLRGDDVYKMVDEGALSFEFFGQTHVVSPEAGLILINEFLKATRNAYGVVELFGKNIGKFDLQVLMNYMDRNVSGGKQVVKEMILDKYCSYRYGDLGTMFYPFFGEMVSLSKIVALFGEKEEVSHVAYEDGIDSIKARRLALYAFNAGVKDLEGLKVLAKEIK